MSPDRAIAPAEGGLRIRVRLTPRAARDAIEGPGADAAGAAHLKVRVRAIPEDGKANKALEALLAKALKVPKSAVSVEKGAAERLKIVRVAGDADALARARRLVGEDP